MIRRPLIGQSVNKKKKMWMTIMYTLLPHMFETVSFTAGTAASDDANLHMTGVSPGNLQCNYYGQCYRAKYLASLFFSMD